MEEVFTPDVNVDYSGPPAVLHLPTEVCENIIDMLYSEYADDTVENIATLHSCSLVCRDWRVRSQRMLFYKVQLADGTSLHRLSTILDAAQDLRGYVHGVDLLGYHLQTTASIFTLFPVVLAGKLPNLRRIDILHVPQGSTWFPRTSDLPAKAKSLPYIPLHPRFPTFLSSFTAVSILRLESTTFRSFSEFARMLHGLPNLETLACDGVRWITLGGADFTKPPYWVAWRRILPPFAPKLRTLWLLDIPMDGAERLILTRGPHLVWLEMTIPLSSDSIEEPARGGGIDLSSCPGLQTLEISLARGFSMVTHAGFVNELLTSWEPQHLEPVLVLRVYQESQFTRRGFADILRGLGTVIETWLQTVEEPSSAGGSEDHHGVQYRLLVVIYDWEAEREWWSDHVDTCFPTWLQLGLLSWDFNTPLSAPFQWAAEKESPQSDAIPQSQLEDVTSSSSSKGDLSAHASEVA
ncbi:hypothetical protein LXA43DRAFT_171537 [Ganoderma leucocontextum]|nr:hypothetical protein LXA43DRAFT_171537 [Ganoderma leucocontextum]